MELEQAIQIVQDANAHEGHCVACAASTNKYWHRLTPVLIQGLIETLRVVKRTDKNEVSKKDLDLTHSQYGNYQKLRFHALIAKHKDEAGVWDGTWLITDRGGQFLRGELRVPLKVQTFRNKVTDHSVETVHIREVEDSLPYAELEFLREIAKPVEQAKAVSWLNDD